jgi:hypothetical protein
LIWDHDGVYYTLTKKRFDNAKDANQHCIDHAGHLVEFKNSKQLTTAFNNLEKIPAFDAQGKTDKKFKSIWIITIKNV